MSKPSDNLVQELMTITKWSSQRVILSLSDLKKHNLIEVRNGKLFLKEVD